MFDRVSNAPLHIIRFYSKVWLKEFDVNDIIMHPVAAVEPILCFYFATETN